MKDLESSTGMVPAVDEAAGIRPGAGVGLKPLFGMTLEELRVVVAGLGQPKYRGAQIFAGMYRQLAGTLEEMRVLPVALRSELEAAG